MPTSKSRPRSTWPTWSAKTANLGATYPEVVAILETANRQKNLSGELVVDAVPASNRVYLEADPGQGYDCQARRRRQASLGGNRQVEAAPVLRHSSAGTRMRRSRHHPAGKSPARTRIAASPARRLRPVPGSTLPTQSAAADQGSNGNAKKGNDSAGDVGSQEGRRRPESLA